MIMLLYYPKVKIFILLECIQGYLHCNYQKQIRFNRSIRNSYKTLMFIFDIMLYITLNSKDNYFDSNGAYSSITIFQTKNSLRLITAKMPPVLCNMSE